MNRSEFIERYLDLVEELQCDAHDVAVSGGGALLMFGLRENTADLDLDVPAAVFCRYLTPRRLEWFGTTPIVNYDNDVSMHVIDPNRRLVQIDGVTCYHPFELLYQKRTLINSPSRKPEKREQDQIDLRKLITLVNNYE